MFKVSVSDIKSFQGCKRQWQLSSRNGMYIRPRVTAPAMVTGQLFHRALHQMYIGSDIDDIMLMVKREMGPEGDPALLTMLPAYYKEVAVPDLERFKVLDVEHEFHIPYESDHWSLEDLDLFGFIDMVVVEKDTGIVYGFEHKSTRSFRNEQYLWMDEQPRVYYYALQQYVAGCNRDTGTEYTFGGIYLNEVKKLLSKFQYKRTLCVYSEEDLNNFMEGFFAQCLQSQLVAFSGQACSPTPGFMSCSMCAYSTICSKHMYETSTLTADNILRDFGEDFKLMESVEAVEEELDI